MAKPAHPPQWPTDRPAPGGAPRIGVSACILGQQVRYDGGHKLNSFIRDTLGTFVEFVAVCPEVEVGMGVPRATLRLVQPGRAGTPTRLIAPATGTDYSEAMRTFARRRCTELAQLDLCGFILKKDSPSCGMERVRVYPQSDGGVPVRTGRGLFAETLMQDISLLPVEEDGRLNDPYLRENFIVRVFAYRRLRSLFAQAWTLSDLIGFHSSEKMLLLAHDRPGYTRLGQLVAGGRSLPRSQLQDDYARQFLSTLSRLATRPKHTNVLQHMAGHCKTLLDSADRAELREVIESYRVGEVPLVVPLTLLRHHVRRLAITYLAGQSYLNPHPRELMLRNHV
jgi:uncharacterized protein YbgA (DUF1722 family)/uncharacterized protein YbbK (DUF523 family)